MIYLRFGDAWYFLKTLLIANPDDDDPPTPRNLPRTASPSEKTVSDMASVVAQDSAGACASIPKPCSELILLSHSQNYA